MPIPRCRCGATRVFAETDKGSISSIACPACTVTASVALDASRLVEDLAEPMRSFFLNRRVETPTA